MKTAINDKEVSARVKESMSSFAKNFGLPVSTLLVNVDYYSNHGALKNERLRSKQLHE